MDLCYAYHSNDVFCSYTECFTIVSGSLNG